MEYRLELGRARKKRRWPAIFALLLALCMAGAVSHCGQAALQRIFAAADAALAEQLLPRYNARLEALQRQNSELRTALAKAAPLRAENEALRQLTGCTRLPDTTIWPPLPCTVLAKDGSGFLVDSPLAPGTPIIDAEGRLAGVCVRQGKRTARLVQPGAAGGHLSCAAAGFVGTLLREDGTLFLAELPRGCTLSPGVPVATLATESCPAGLWVGRLAEAPQADESGLTCRVQLTDTAQPAGIYFALPRE